MRARSDRKAERLEKSRALQRVLYRRAKQDPNRRFHRRRPVRDCACLAVNGVGSRVRENRMPGLMGGRWRSGSHGQPEGCAHRETGGIEPGRLQLADQPAAYLTGFPEWRDEV